MTERVTDATFWGMLVVDAGTELAGATFGALSGTLVEVSLLIVRPERFWPLFTDAAVIRIHL